MEEQQQQEAGAAKNTGPKKSSCYEHADSMPMMIPNWLESVTTAMKSGTNPMITTTVMVNALKAVDKIIGQSVKFFDATVGNDAMFQEVTNLVKAYVLSYMKQFVAKINRTTYDDTQAFHVHTKLRQHLVQRLNALIGAESEEWLRQVEAIVQELVQSKRGGGRNKRKSQSRSKSKRTAKRRRSRRRF